MQLYGARSLDKDWQILNSRYWDTMMIERKLEDLPKGLKPRGKIDTGGAIDLEIKVKDVGTCLEVLNMEVAHNHDKEFLSYLCNVLSDRHKGDWCSVPNEADVYLKRPLIMLMAYIERLPIIQTVSDPLPTGGLVYELPLHVSRMVVLLISESLAICINSCYLSY